jgi:mono/diheme cytochrome c family protein
MTRIALGRGIVIAAWALLWHATVPAQAMTAVDGRAIFQARCVVCHGVRADGRSDLARIMRPPPANLRASKLSDDEQASIVRLGGAAMGRSPNMPEWRVELTEDELLAVLAYIQTIRGTMP